MCRTIHKIALITNLTQSLVDIELKYDSTTDKPMYRERGADTWLPFSGGQNFIPEGKCLQYYTVQFIDLPNASSPATSYNVAGTGFIFNCKDGTTLHTKSGSYIQCYGVKDGVSTLSQISSSNAYISTTIDQNYDYIVLRTPTTTTFSFYVD